MLSILLCSREKQGYGGTLKKWHSPFTWEGITLRWCIMRKHFFLPFSSSVETTFILEVLSFQTKIQFEVSLTRYFDDGIACLLYWGEGGKFGLFFSCPCCNFLIVTGVDHLVIVWEIASGTAVAHLTAHTGVVYTLCFSRDGTVLASGKHSIPVHSCRL